MKSFLARNDFEFEFSRVGQLIAVSWPDMVVAGETLTHALTHARTHAAPTRRRPVCAACSVPRVFAQLAGIVISFIYRTHKRPDSFGLSVCERQLNSVTVRTLDTAPPPPAPSHQHPGIGFCFCNNETLFVFGWKLCFLHF